MKIDKGIKDYKEQLIRRVKKIGIWENFGQTEVSILESNYSDHQYLNDGVWEKIRDFDNWCMDFTGE